MVTKQVQFGVVGCGAIGKRHLAVVSSDAETTLAAMCEVDRSKHDELARLHPRVPIYEKFETFLAHPGLDVVAICTPHGLHASMAIAALKAGLHVLVEKPMALSVCAAQAMIAAA
jgi:predicted dehydrogenase